jgi:hypothetical protein
MPGYVSDMPPIRRFELEDLSNRPGTYFNPETEVLIVVDDTAAVADELPEDTTPAGEWVLVSDDVPVDEHRRDELLEHFQARSRPVHGRDDEEGFDDEEPEDEEDELDADDVDADDEDY